jgi:RsiW-degrading membrane proteinase PrsW (M82 family)
VPAIVVSLLPVTVFLLALVLVDSHKLVSTPMLARALGAGALAALAGAALHTWLLDLTGLAPSTLSRYVAPVTEETLKALFLVYALRRRQIGFLVDAAIVGFAVGAGFAVVENIEYLRSLPDRHLWLWIARGFGTAVLHASTTAIVAMVAKALLDRSPRRGLTAVAPGWLLAVVLHAAYNHAPVSPALAAALLLVGMPLLVMAVFSRSEKITREWVSDGLDLDVELLQLVRTSHFGGTRLGRYLTELRSRFPGPVVADMFCLLQLDLELSIRARGMLMAREEGLDLPIDDGLRAQLAERAYLERSIGPTGLLALRPLQVTTDRDRWHRYLLDEAGSPARSWWAARKVR